MKIGIYGGTYNPPHLGHLAAAKAVFELLELDRLWLIPAGTPPHKTMPSGSPTSAQRLEMTRLAAEQLGLGDKVEVLDLEINRGGKSFTSDTIAELKAIGGEEICPLAKEVTAEKVEKWHREGLNVRAWGVVNEDLMRKVYDCGADGMTVNFPDKLTEYIRVQTEE